MKKSFFTGANVAKLSMYVAMVVLLSYTPIGNLLIGPIQLTTMHIPVILAGAMGGIPYGVIVGTAFGLTSMLRAMQGLSGPLSFAFMNPLVSVLPRVVLGLFAGFFGAKLQGKKSWLGAGLIAFLATLLHTLLVLSTLYYLYGGQIASSQGLSAKAVAAIVLGTSLSNGLPEAILASLITAPVVRIFRERRAPGKRIGSELRQRENK